MFTIYNNRDTKGNFIELDSGEKVYLKDEQLELVRKGYDYKDGKFVETEESKEKTSQENERQIKLEKKEAILDIASISDQLNLTAGTLDIVVDLLAKSHPELLENDWIKESKAKLESIKTILNSETSSSESNNS